jgi:hypothetical protein
MLVRIRLRRRRIRQQMSDMGGSGFKILISSANDNNDLSFYLVLFSKIRYQFF